MSQIFSCDDSKEKDYLKIHIIFKELMSTFYSNSYNPLYKTYFYGI